jgi:four helix bundle protein
VWQKAMELTELVYAIARHLPPEERFGLVPQMTRAAVSIPANIAEGKGRGTQREYIQFIRIAHGSLRELETYVELIIRLGYISPTLATPIQDLIDQIGKMLTALKARLSGTLTRQSA